MIVWGADVSTKGMALAIVGGENPLTLTIPFADKARGAKRLADAHVRLHQWLPDYLRWGDPDAVFVEQPFGKFPKASLEQMVGVVLCAFGQVVSAPVVELPVARWKALSVGKGNATKAEVLDWAHSLGYRGASEDEADALGVAVAGVFLCEREPEALDVS